MSFSEAISACFSNYACFSGRARRSEFWFFYLFQISVSILLAILSVVLFPLGLLFRILSVIFELICFIPGLAVSVRRLHDTGHSGWCLLFPSICEMLTVLFGLGVFIYGRIYLFFLVLAILFTIISVIALLVLFCTDSEYGKNEYGSMPDYKGDDSSFHIPVISIEEVSVARKTVLMEYGKYVVKS